ncbi:MAG: hypothetical protein ABEJ64_01950 [Candidatus Nanohaloarchaea archaeon]
MEVKINREAVRELNEGRYGDTPNVFVRLDATYRTSFDLFESPNRFSVDVKTRQRGLAYSIEREAVEFESTARDRENLSSLMENWDGRMDVYGYRIVSETDNLPLTSETEFPHSPQEAVEELEQNDPTLIFHVVNGDSSPVTGDVVQVNYSGETFRFSDHPYSSRNRRETASRLESTLEETGLDYEKGRLKAVNPDTWEKAVSNPLQLVRELLSAREESPEQQTEW